MGGSGACGDAISRWGSSGSACAAAAAPAAVTALRTPRGPPHARAQRHRLHAAAGTVASGHSALRQLASEVSGEADLARVFGEVVELSTALFGADKVGIWTVEPGDHPFRLAAHRGLGPRLLGLVEGLRPTSRTGAVRAMSERRTVVLDRPTARGTTAEMRDAYRAEGIRTACLVPVVHLDEPSASSASTTSRGAPGRGTTSTCSRRSPPRRRSRSRTRGSTPASRGSRRGWTRSRTSPPS